MATKNNLKSLLEKLLLVEQTPIVLPQSSQEFGPVINKPVSLDQAVDKYFIQYEREAIPTSEIYESVNQLLEQVATNEEPAEEEEEGDEDLAAAEEGAGNEADPSMPPETESPGGMATNSPGESEISAIDNGDLSPVVATPKINLNDFARSVARLTNNINSLIDVQTILLNRASSYIESNYDEMTAKELMEILEVTYGLVPNDGDPNNIDQRTTEYPETYTVGANGSGNG